MYNLSKFTSCMNTNLKLVSKLDLELKGNTLLFIHNRITRIARVICEVILFH